MRNVRYDAREKRNNFTFSEELKKLLKARGITPAQLAKDIDISHVAIGNYLKGRIPHSDILLQIARYFGVTAEALLYGPAAEKTVPARRTSPEVETSAAQLSEIRAVDPESFMALRRVIANQHRAITPTSFSKASKPAAAPASALQVARNELQESARKRKAAAPSEHKRALKPDAPLEREHKPESPAQAQE